MQLIDRQIHKAIKKGDLAFGCPLPAHPFAPETQVQPASIDLRLGNRIVRFRSDIEEFNVRDLKRVGEFLEVQYLEDRAEIRIGPQEIVFGQIYEQIAIGDEYSARIEGRSRMARLGVSVHCTGDYINPGFAGAMPLQLVNHNSFTLVLYPFMNICQMIVYKLTSRPLVSYAERSALPVNQYYGETNPGASVLDRDPTLTSPSGSESILLGRIRALIQNYMDTMDQDWQRVNQTDSRTGDVIVQIKNIVKEQKMGDQYIAKQAGIQGPHAGTNAEVRQVLLTVGSAEQQQLLGELSKLRPFLKQADTEGEHDVEIGRVAEAEKELRQGNQKGFLSALAGGGKWVLEKATDVGCALLVRYIGSQIGD